MLRTKIKPPYFELGPKNYMLDRRVEELSATVRKAAERYDIRAIYSAPFIHLERIADAFAGSEHCYVFAPYMDDLPLDSKTGSAMPERLKACGVQGVYINHSSLPQSLGAMIRMQARAEHLGLYTMACADSVKEIQATAIIAPDIIIAEPEELIGSGQSADAEYIRASSPQPTPSIQRLASSSARASAAARMSTNAYTMAPMPPAAPRAYSAPTIRKARSTRCLRLCAGAGMTDRNNGNAPIIKEELS